MISAAMLFSKSDDRIRTSAAAADEKTGEKKVEKRIIPPFSFLLCGSSPLA